MLFAKMKSATAAGKKEATSPGAPARPAVEESEIRSIPPHRKRRPQTDTQCQANDLIDFREHHHTSLFTRDS